MRDDAEAGGAQWSIAEDDRVTRVGRVLRRTHIDELPQVINVLRGEMTLVGPRPERPEMIAALERLFPHYKQRILVKPGVTGWAQVRCGYAGSDLGSAWKLCHDLFYLKHRSMLADTLIILETLAIAAKDAHRPLRAPQPEFLTVQTGLAAPPAEPMSRDPGAELRKRARPGDSPGGPNGLRTGRRALGVRVGRRVWGAGRPRATARPSRGPAAGPARDRPRTRCGSGRRSTRGCDRRSPAASRAAGPPPRRPPRRPRAGPGWSR